MTAVACCKGCPHLEGRGPRSACPIRGCPWCRIATGSQKSMERLDAQVRMAAGGGWFVDGWGGPCPVRAGGRGSKPNRPTIEMRGPDEHMTDYNRLNDEVSGRKPGRIRSMQRSPRISTTSPRAAESAIRGAS